jgi:hypothetical protein
MDKAYPTKTTMVVGALEMDTDPFRMKSDFRGLLLKCLGPTEVNGSYTRFMKEPVGLINRLIR